MMDVEALETRLGHLLRQVGLKATVEPGRLTPLTFGDQLLLLSCFARDDRTWLRITAPFADEVHASLALLHRLLHLNAEATTGAFQLFDADQLAFANTLDAECLTPDVLEHALTHAGRMARTFGPELIELGQGRALSA